MARKSNKSKKDGADVPMGKPRKEPKAAKAPKAARAKAHNAAAVNDQRSKDQVRENFLHHWGIWKRVSAKQKLLDKEWTQTKAALKADGHKVLQMHIADDLHDTPKSEAKVHTAVHDRILVADMTGHPMGRQLDLFTQPDRTPAADRAYDEGKQASMENKPRKPPYDTSVPQYQRWLEGYQDHQSALSKGFKPLTEKAKDNDGWGESDPARPLN